MIFAAESGRVVAVNECPHGWAESGRPLRNETMKRNGDFPSSERWSNRICRDELIAMKNAGLSLRQIARYAGVQKSTVCAWLAGRKPVRSVDVLRIRVAHELEENAALRDFYRGVAEWLK